MAWKGDSGAAFSGGSGQMAVMGELLHRKCNAAIPLVDVGTDVFAFREDREEVARIQVKTEAGTWYKRGEGYRAKFGVPMKQLSRTDSPPLFYAFAVRLDNSWGSFIVISRAKLRELWNDGCGSENEKSGDLEMHIQFRPDEKSKRDEARKYRELTAVCGKFDLTDYINAWETLPPLKTPVAIDSPVHAPATLTEGGGHAPKPILAELQIGEIDREPPQA
ncbi:MAG: hypothetical protein WCJ35_21560 [Planctomycetota bacterium]